jgi:anti-sigma regulatory factor (Ser/Thr protein kinase)
VSSQAIEQNIAHMCVVMIFISYRISDSLDLVGRLDADLTAIFGHHLVFRDRTRLHAGDEWPDIVREAVRSCRVMLVVIGATWDSASLPEGDWKCVPRLWNPDDWVRKEVTSAIDGGKIVIPLLLNGARLPSDGWLKKCGLEALKSKQAHELRSRDYEEDLKRLLTELSRYYPDVDTDRHLTPIVADVRRSVARIDDTAETALEWDAQFGSRSMTISAESRERILHVPELISSKMQAAGFLNEICLDYQLALGEAISNAFQHGCAELRDEVTLQCDIDRHYASFAVLNPAHRRFDLQVVLAEASARLAANPRSRRGRGLLLIRQLADTLISVENHRGIKATFERDRVVYAVSHVDDVVVASLLQGIMNSSFESRTLSLVESEADRHLLLDFSRWETGGTAVYTVILDAEAILARAEKSVVALLFPRRGQYFSPIKLPSELIAYTVRDAATRLARPYLAERIGAEIARTNLRPLG